MAKAAKPRITLKALPDSARDPWRRLTAARHALGPRFDAAVANLVGARNSPAERKAFFAVMNAIETADKWAQGYVAGNSWADETRVTDRILSAATLCERYAAKGVRSV